MSRHPAETISPIRQAAEECAPFVRGEPEHRAARVRAVADADPSGMRARYLDAIAVGQAQRALSPARDGAGLAAGSAAPGTVNHGRSHGSPSPGMERPPAPGARPVWNASMK